MRLCFFFEISRGRDCELGIGWSMPFQGFCCGAKHLGVVKSFDWARKERRKLRTGADKTRYESYNKFASFAKSKIYISIHKTVNQVINPDSMTLKISEIT